METKTKKNSGSEHAKSKVANKDTIPAAKFAFPKEKKEPLNDADHVRNAMARFDQVKGVSDEERIAAFERIKKAAKKFGIQVKEKDWKELAHRK